MSKKVVVYKKSEDESISKAGRLYHFRRENSLCVKCGKGLDDSSKFFCTSHLTYYNNWHAAKKAKINAALELLNAQEVKAEVKEVKKQVKKTK